jgi:protein-S-isoprenylcysteine O-methyltransferase Ste14
MWQYIIYALLMLYIFYWLISVIRKRMVGETYEAFGLGLYFTQIFWSQYWMKLDIQTLRVIGFSLFIPALLFVAASFATLKAKGKPTDSWESTTSFVQNGVYRVTRHPMFFGTAIWSFALVLVIQSLISVILALIAIFCFWMASKKEEEFNLTKFGNEYRKYLDTVPRWNFIKGMKHLKREQNFKI